MPCGHCRFPPLVRVPLTDLLDDPQGPRSSAGAWSSISIYLRQWPPLSISPAVLSSKDSPEDPLQAPKSSAPSVSSPEKEPRQTPSPVSSSRAGKNGLARPASARSGHTATPSGCSWTSVTASDHPLVALTKHDDKIIRGSQSGRQQGVGGYLEMSDFM